jgi:hypothetical protein
MLFPILLFESIKGFMELFVSEGLPDNISQAQRVVDKADILEEEPWDMRFGDGMWKLITNGNEIKMKSIPEFMNLVSQLNSNEIISLLKELSHNTKRGRLIMSNIIKKADYSTEYAKFSYDLSNRNSEKTIVEDSYFSPEELVRF